mmetsp:Transcript_8811/g.16018  ORF Transcript_8811/g.16018 Transcript_8811/m.16018 type:complete len:87 (+) Transcript_8811:278-538(+)
MRFGGFLHLNARLELYLYIMIIRIFEPRIMTIDNSTPSSSNTVVTRSNTPGKCLCKMLIMSAGRGHDSSNPFDFDMTVTVAHESRE